MINFKYLLLSLLWSTMRTQDFMKCRKCKFEGRYVCGASGITYPSKCHAKCAGESEFIEG